MKRIRTHAKGRFGIVHKKSCHLTVVLREIDFDEKIAATTSRRQRERLERIKAEVAQERLSIDMEDDFDDEPAPAAEKKADSATA